MTTDFYDMSLDKSRLLPNPCYSMKEIEENLKSLTKENFNLKLRIYFLEMRSEGSKNTVNGEDSKEFFQLIMENESLKNDLDEKHGLIKQAAMAIDILEQNQKEKILEYDNEQNNQLRTIKAQNNIIESLKLVINSLNKSENLQDNRNEVKKLKKECKLFLGQSMSFEEDKSRMEVSSKQFLKNEVRDDENLQFFIFD